MYRLILIMIIPMLVACTDDNVFEVIVEDAPAGISNVIAHPDKYEVQVLYVQIDRDRHNLPLFEEYLYRVDDTQYFYPASTVKMPVAVLAMDKLRRLNRPGLDFRTRMEIDSSRFPQSVVLGDSTSADGTASVGHYARKIFIVSDNDAFNRLYEFVGQQEIHERLQQIGITQTRISHRLSDFRFGPDENRFTNPVKFFNNDTFVYAQPEVHAPFIDWVQPHNQIKGKAHVNTDGQLVEQPFDFSQKNFFPLRDQVEVLKRVMFPEVFDSTSRFALDEEDYVFLYEAMSTLPHESRYPAYPGEDYFDGYVKFLMYGDTEEDIPSHIRIFNKVGWAYGYLTDCAYIVDFENNIEFILAATIHVNANETYNDGVYEFDEVGVPFLAELGRQVYDFELQRKRSHAPDLSRYKANYND